MLRDYLPRLLNGLKSTVNSSYRDLDFKFVKEKVLYLVKVGSRPVVKELK